jgi:hypothetical protein
MVKSALLFGTPILIGILYFLVEAPRQESGVYVETNVGIYRLSTYTPSDRLAETVLSGAPAVAGDSVDSFFIVAPRGSRLSAGAPSASVCLFVVDAGALPVPSACEPVPSSVVQVNPEVYRVKAEELRRWGSDAASFRLYRQILQHSVAPRARLDVMAALVLPVSGEPPRMYSVRLAPQGARITNQLTLGRR